MLSYRNWSLRWNARGTLMIIDFNQWNELEQHKTMCFVQEHNMTLGPGIETTISRSRISFIKYQFRPRIDSFASFLSPSVHFYLPGRNQQSFLLEKDGLLPSRKLQRCATCHDGAPSTRSKRSVPLAEHGMQSIRILFKAARSQNR